MGKRMNDKLRAKINESLSSVLPVAAIVLILCFTIAPLPNSVLMLFLMGTLFLIVGMGLFTLGAEMAMTPIGEAMGAHMTKKRSLFWMVLGAFLIGIIITIAEPDLQVLAQQVPSIPNASLIGAVALGVGIFLVLALLRILFNWRLSYLLIGFYIVVFVLAALSPDSFLTVAFDSGGVTTGPMTVPFIMALGVGVSSVRSDKNAESDSFGLVALCSIGPILAVLLLGNVYQADSGTYTPHVIPQVNDTVELWATFRNALPHYCKEVAMALGPIVIFFLIYQLVALKLALKQLARIGVGLGYTFLGLVLFLTGANVGFLPAGNFLGQQIACLDYAWIIIPIGMVIGYFIVAAEPAVHILNKQVEELTEGAISQKSMQRFMSLGVAVSLALAMIRVLTGISIFWFLIPGYAVAIILTFFVPKIFTSIAFDSGGVASGPMTATFLLPFAMGACEALGGNVISDAFGIVAMVAMTPLITIQIMGLIYRMKQGKGLRTEPEEVLDLEIIDV